MKRVILRKRAFVERLEGRALLTSIVVNTVLDITSPPAGTVSLRSAIATANASSTPTTITFSPTVFATAQTIVLNGNDLELSNTNEATTITGPSTGVTVSGNNASGVFVIDGNVIATLSNLTITKGSEGGIISYGTMTLTNVAVSDNNTTSGGIYSTGTLTLANVTVAGNGGGGISNGGTATLTDVTVSGNTASSYGGGVRNGGTATLVNVTVFDNSANDLGGGIYNGGTVTLINDTVFGNSSNEFGGGIYNAVQAANFTVANTIVAGDTAPTGPDVDDGFNSYGYNLIGATDGSTGWNAADLTGTAANPLSAKLGPLANNGGFTQTMLPLAGSPAIGAGNPAYIPAGITTDQRGDPRSINGAVDIGSVEVGAAVSTPTPVVTGVSVDSTAWASSFPYASGYPIPTGSSQLTDLPWINLNQVNVTFNEAVNVAQGDLTINGVNTPNYTISNFSYNPTAFTATWTLGSSIAADKLVLDLSGTGNNAVTSATGDVPLDGGWTNGTSTFPSGNNSPGTNFDFDVNVLPGDVKQTGGPVTILDVIAVRNAQLTSAENTGYSPLDDVDGSGSINILDVVDVRNRQLTSLPTSTLAIANDAATPAEIPATTILGPATSTGVTMQSQKAKSASELRPQRERRKASETRLMAATGEPPALPVDVGQWIPEFRPNRLIH
jgi:hypothetical protein